MKRPNLSDRVVSVSAYLTDKVFGYAHWRAAQFSAPRCDRVGVLILCVNEDERTAVLAQLSDVLAMERHPSINAVEPNAQRREASDRSLSEALTKYQAEFVRLQQEYQTLRGQQFRQANTITARQASWQAMRDELTALQQGMRALEQEMRTEVLRIGKDFDIHTVPSVTVWSWADTLARLATPTGAVMTWQLIETAPKDGMAFRAYGPSLVDPDFNPWGSVEAVYDGEQRLIGAVWDGCHDIWRTAFIEATHWAPLPDPPQEA